MTSKNVKPGRPLGVTIAILVSVVFYSIIPLLQIGVIFLVEQRFREASQTASPFGGQTVSGGNFRGDIADERIIFQAVVAVIFLVIAYFTWRGRPKTMRILFMIAVLAMTAATLVLSIAPASDGEGMSGSSLDVVLNVAQYCWLAITTFLIPLYVVWYLNRGPARAFYRGYYLPIEPESSAQP